MIRASASAPERQSSPERHFSRGANFSHLFRGALSRASATLMIDQIHKPK